ncbi:hypothetical protein [Nocardioides sambongensis]|uniref:hypothetical protein n=1 Tax=Nocardioides sambongensis TaxID=2589074 RepID=UPI00112C15B8|nr:hypothetical protein [Nocardioides sambongensis]
MTELIASLYRPGAAPTDAEKVAAHQAAQDAATAAQTRRNALRDRHARNLTTLMTERDDLRGVHALADFVDDAVRWSA